MKYIFLFTLGPVQSFIAQARKTQDLHAGSLILSDLTREAAKAAKKEQGITLVFPQNTEGVVSFPNRFIGTIEGDFKNVDLQKKGRDIEDKIIKAFQKLADKALVDTRLGFQIAWEAKEPLSPQLQEDFKQQINNHLDINWLFHPVTTYDNNAYKEVEAIMAALKNTRFIRNNHPETGRKCSLDGERNALFFGQDSNPIYIHFNRGKIIDKNVWLRKNEGLSAISLVKRAYEKQEFPSTAEVALKYQIEQLDKDKPDLVKCYKQLFSRDYPIACTNLLLKGHLDSINLENAKDDWCTDFDERFLFEENLTDKDIINETQLKIAKEVQDQFKKYLTQKYYAIIAFDGDKMGKLLSGETRVDKIGDLADFQSTISGLLMSFSKWIYDTLNKKTVDVIYTGGDDFLGFVNLNHLFCVVKTLRIEFDKQVNLELKKKYELESDLSFSMGITIAHYKTPLSMVLQKTRDLEKLAKQTDKGNRDAFAISVLKHSGVSHEAYFNWEFKEGKLPKWTAFEQLVKYFQEDCSETFVRALDRELYNLQDGKGTVKNNAKKLEYKDEKTKEKVDKQISMIETELLRLAYKSLEEGKKGKAADLKNTVMQFLKTNEKIMGDSIEVDNGMEAVKAALFIKRENKKAKV